MPLIVRGGDRGRIHLLDGTRVLAVAVVVTGATLVSAASPSMSVMAAPPLAVDDVAVAAAGTTIDIDVVANDSDPDSDALSLATVSTPGVGTAAAVTNSTIRYTAPAGAFAGTSFSYVVEDGNGEAAGATVTVSAGCGDEVIEPGAGAAALDAAVSRANACPGPQAISVDGGRYATAGLTITDTLTIAGLDPSAPPLLESGAASGTVVRTTAGADVTLTDLAVQTTGNWSFLFQRGATVVLDRVAVNMTDVPPCGSGVGTGASVGSGATLRLATSSITGAPCNGISLFGGSTLTLDSSRIAGSGNHGVDVSGSTVDVEQSEIVGNDAAGLHSTNPASTLDLSTSFVADNGEEGVAWASGTVTVADSFFGLLPDGAGGLVAAGNADEGIRADFADVDLDNAYVAHNGAGVYLGSGPTRTHVVDRSEIRDNAGTGLLASGSVVDLAGTTLARNGPNCVVVAGFINDGGGNADDDGTCPVVSNNPPTGVDDAFEFIPGSALIVPAPGVLDNDNDPDGDVLSAVLESDVTGGVLTLLPDGSFRYVADASTAGDGFSYRVSDGSATSAPITVRLLAAIPNTPPVAVDDDASTAEDTPLAGFDVLANDTDDDGDALTSVLVDGPAHAADFSLAGDGTVTYTPATNFFGSDSFTYVADDGTDRSPVATVTIDVTPVNDAPVLTPPPGPVEVEENSSVAVPIGFDDVDGNDPPGQDDDTDLLVVLNAEHGDLTVTAAPGVSAGVAPNGALGMNAADVAALADTLATATYTPDADYVGVDTITVAAVDNGENGAGDIGETSIDIDVTVLAIPNRPPTAALADVAVDEGAGSVVLDARQSADPDGDPLTYRWSGNVADLGDGTASFKSTADDAVEGVFVEVCDPEAACDRATAVVTVTNVDPAVTVVAGEPTVVGVDTPFEIEIDDPGADTHVASIDWGDGTSDASTPIVDGAVRTHQYTAAGTFEATVTVTDDDGGETSAVVPVEVVESGLDVNSTGTDGDTAPGDGVCWTGDFLTDGRAECTLQAVIEETNALPGTQTVGVEPGEYPAGVPPIVDPLGLAGVPDPVSGDDTRPDLERLALGVGFDELELSGVNIEALEIDGSPSGDIVARLTSASMLGDADAIDITLLSSVWSTVRGRRVELIDSTVTNVLGATETLTMIRSNAGRLQSLDAEVRAPVATIVDSTVFGAIRTSTRLDASNSLFSGTTATDFFPGTPFTPLVPVVVESGDATIEQSVVTGADLISVGSGGPATLRTENTLLNAFGDIGERWAVELWDGASATLSFTTVVTLGPAVVSPPGAAATADFIGSVLYLTDGCVGDGLTATSASSYAQRGQGCTGMLPGGLDEMDFVAPVDGTFRHWQLPITSSALEGASGVACPVVDLLGNPRPIDADGDGDAQCDAGSIERQQTNTAPSITVNSVLPDVMLQGESVAIVGTVVEPEDQRVTVDLGARLSATDLPGTFPIEARFDAVDVGPNTIEITACDPFGLCAVYTRTITVEPATPQIVIDLPATADFGDTVDLDVAIDDPFRARTWSAAVDWGDGATDAGACGSAPPDPFENYRCSFDHALTDLGQRDVVVTVTSNFGDVITETRQLEVVAPPVAINTTADTPDLTPGDGLCFTGVFVADGAPACSLRAALTEVEAAGVSVTVELPAGVYDLTDDITFAGSIHLIGDGESSLIRSTFAQDLQFDGEVHLERVRLEAEFWNGSGRLILTDSTVDGVNWRGGSFAADGSTIDDSLVRAASGASSPRSIEAERSTIVDSRLEATELVRLAEVDALELVILANTIDVVDSTIGTASQFGGTTITGQSVAFTDSTLAAGFVNGSASVDVTSTVVDDSIIAGDRVTVVDGTIGAGELQGREVAVDASRLDRVNLVAGEGGTVAASVVTLASATGDFSFVDSTVELIGEVTTVRSWEFDRSFVGAGSVDALLVPFLDATVSFSNSTIDVDVRSAPTVSLDLVFSTMLGTVDATESGSLVRATASYVAACGVDVVLDALASAGGCFGDADELLAPLSDNGGPTVTARPLSTNPLIDGADGVVCPPTDQRGEPRPFDGDDDGVAVCDIGAVEVQEVLNLAPIAVLPPGFGADEGADVVFAASSSSDPDGDALAFTWALPDGTVVAGDQATYRPPDDAVEQVMVEVCDPGGLCDTAVTTLTVTNVAPIIDVTATPTEVFADEPVTIRVEVDDVPADQHEARIDPGTGKFEPPVRLDGDTIEFERTFPSPGTYDVVVEVVDDDGGVAEATVAVVVANQPPTGSIVLRGRASGRPAVVLANADDPDGEIVEYRWSIGGTPYVTASPALDVVYPVQETPVADVEFELVLVDDLGAETTIVSTETLVHGGAIYTILDTVLIEGGQAEPLQIDWVQRPLPGEPFEADWPRGVSSCTGDGGPLFYLSGPEGPLEYSAADRRLGQRIEMFSNDPDAEVFVYNPLFLQACPDVLDGEPQTATFTLLEDRSFAVEQTGNVIVLPDTVPPSLGLPDDVTVELSGPSTAVQVTFVTSAFDDVDGSVPVQCTPASGTTFFVGDTEVSCTATDAAGNTTVDSFVVSVVGGIRASIAGEDPDRVPAKRPGEQATVTVADLQPGSTARVEFRSEPVVLADTVVEADGTVSIPIVIPGDATPGEHTIVVLATASDGRAVEFHLPVEITAPQQCTIVGTPGTDVLIGTAGPDVICGGGGADLIAGLGGDDVLLGGPGRDLVFGGPGDDRMWGGAGWDLLDGGRGDDHAVGGRGIDVIRRVSSATQFGPDQPPADTTLPPWPVGASLDCTVIGTADADNLVATSGDDVVCALGGDDSIWGLAGDDVVDGGPGRDATWAGRGHDVCVDVERRWSCDATARHTRLLPI